MGKTISNYVFTDADLTEFANQVKEVLVATLHAEGELPGAPEKLSAQYTVVVAPAGALGRLWSKLRGINDESARISVLKCTDGAGETCESD